MNDPGGTYRYPEPVRIELRDDVVDDYLQAAKFLNRAGFDLVSLQHEYGIFGGAATLSSCYHASICRSSRRFILSFRTQILASAM